MKKNGGIYVAYVGELNLQTLFLYSGRNQIKVNCSALPTYINMPFVEMVTNYLSLINLQIKGIEIIMQDYCYL